MAKSNTTHAAIRRELNTLSGYKGSIQCTPLDSALDEQRFAIWEAQAIIDCAAASMREHYGEWPEGLANWPLALRRASKILEDATWALDAGPLEDRGLAIARAKKSAAAPVAGGEVANG